MMKYSILLIKTKVANIYPNYSTSFIGNELIICLKPPLQPIETKFLR